MSLTIDTPPERDIRSILHAFGIQPAYDLSSLLDFAEQIHELRQTIETRVSRSALLYAALRCQPLVQAVLEANGLRVSAFEQSLSLAGPPPLEPRNPEVNFDITEETTGKALMDYAERWPKRPLDVLGIAAVVMANATGAIERHLRTSGLNIPAAAERAATLVNASVEGDGNIGTAESRFIFSGLVQQILDAAGQMLGEYDIAFPPLTTSIVLITIAQWSNSNPLTAVAFLRDYVLAKVSEAGLRATVDQWVSWYDNGRVRAVRNVLTQRLAAVLERATQIAKSASRREHIEARHLVGALIGSAHWTQNTGASDLLDTLGIDPDALARDFHAWLEKNAPPTGGDDLAAWRLFLGIRDETFLARFSAEQSAGEDWLNIDSHVQAFATMIASDRITPPLAIGLFGDWGSGKSFFMAKLREAITNRAARAQGRKDTPYYRRIVQIEFNAWHYVESNLWASLVENVFSNLKLTTGDNKDAVARRRAELAKQIDTLIADRAAAEEKLQKAEVARSQAANDLDAKTKHAETSASGLRGLQAVSVWELVEIDDASRNALNEALQGLGVKAVLTSKEDIRKTLDDLRASGKRAEVIRTWITGRPAGLTILALLIIVTPLAISLAAWWLHQQWPDLNTTVTQVIAPIGTALVWLAARVKQGNGIFDKIDGARHGIDTKLEEAEKQRQGEIKTADDRLKVAVADVETAKNDLGAQEMNVAKAKQDLIELSRGRRLARFISERAESDDYRKFLGVLATVRHDFSTLSRLMYPEEEEENSLDDEYKLDRIILYIDDLDRCPPDRVVEVLQAVHLLLAFKLFVVVVGVDARWVSESLRYKHRALREKNSTDLRDDDAEMRGYAAKPHDYLEKIFQVPFWLEPLDQSTTANYIGRLLADDIGGQTDEPNTRGGTPPPIGRASSGASTPGESSSEQPSTRRRRPDDVDPKQLTIDIRELDFMQTSSIVTLVSRSPRTAKRFVNTYRFLRARVPSHELDDYLAEEIPARYKVVLTLLAVVVGAPDVALELFDVIKRPKNAHLTLEELAGTLDTFYVNHPDLDEWQRVSVAMKGLGSGAVIVAGLRLHLDDIARYSFHPPHGQRAKPRPREPFPIRIVPP